MMVKIIELAVVLILALFGSTEGCGMMTHMEIAFRAMENFNRTYKGLDVRQLAAKHPDALHTGAVYPDSYYSNLCYKGEFHDTSETTHWMKFFNASLDYFDKKYTSKPLDEAGEKLLTFLLGVMAHDMADVLWHSLGIDQGFIQTMGQVNFHGSYSDAHNVADPGGDVVNLYEMFYPDTYAVKAFEWYVPVQDMLNVYSNMGIPFNETIIKACAVDLMQVGADAERDTFDKLYPTMGAKSPFLTSALSDFFLGGMQEMAAWVMQRWMTTFMYLENNGKNCTNTEGPSGKNPMYWVCGNQTQIKPPPLTWLPSWQQDGSMSAHERHHRAKKAAFDRLSEKAKGSYERGAVPTKIHVRSDHQAGGVYLTAAKPQQKSGRIAVMNNRVLAQICNSSTYFTFKSYSLVGKSLVSADVNHDGFDDLIVSAPGFSLDNRFQEGRVFLVLGSALGLPQKEMDLATANYVFLPPYMGEGRFGYSVVALDFNDDGALDLAISAPLYSPNVVDHLYSGQVYIYYGRKNSSIIFDPTTPNLTIDCGMRYCNFGSTLSVGDVNRDGKVDLIVASPFASQTFNTKQQNGFVAVYYSKNSTSRSSNMNVSNADLVLQGPMPYSWFGFSVTTTPGQCNIIIGAPATNQHLANGSIAQMAGAVYCYQLTSKNLSIFANGSKEFDNFGSGLALGYPNGKKAASVLAIAAANAENNGKLYKILPLTLNQSGSVYFYHPTPGSQSYGKLAGDRHYGVFGRYLQFANVNNDDYDDLLIGAPVRQPHLTDLGKGEAVGELYLYLGNISFPQSVLSRPCRGDEDPCPGDQADKTFNLGDDKAQFGSNAAHLNTRQLVVSAPRTDDYARQSGKLIVYTGCGV